MAVDKTFKHTSAMARHPRNEGYSTTPVIRLSRLFPNFVLSIASILGLLLTSLSTPVQCYGVMSIDLGSEWMKVGLVAPSVQMDLVLNAQSQRKTPMAIAISNNRRFIGDSAIDVAIKFPERTFTHFLDLVGKTVDDESVKIYKKRFPYADISSHEPNSSSIILKHPQGSSFTPIELIAMMLEHAHDQVMKRLMTNEVVKDVVITVPPFFNARERKVIVDAAEVVGLNVLRLTNSNSAFALSYGIFRHKDYQPEDSSNKTTILFFDQGASQTSATIADYHLVEQLDPITRDLKNETLPTVSIRAQVFDRFLGGLDMQLKLRDHIVKSFSEKTKIPESKVYKRDRSSSKVLYEAGRVKRVLSANSDFLIRIENVIDGIDLKLPITRQEYETLNEDLLVKQTVSVLDRLFELTNTSRDEKFESVIIVGGNTRTPKIQKVLMDYFKLESLGKSVNADEGAALAALYQAASLGRGFRVKKFVLEEYGEERVRYDPARIVDAATTSTTTHPPTQAETATAASSEAYHSTDPSVDVASELSQAVSEESTTTTTTDAPTVMSDPNSIYSKLELIRIRDKLARMRHEDLTRLQRLSLRNSLESLLSEGRNMEIRQENLDTVINEIQLWLEEGPIEERDNMTLLADKYTQVYDLIHPPPPPSPLPQSNQEPIPESVVVPESNSTHVEL